MAAVPSAGRAAPAAKRGQRRARPRSGRERTRSARGPDTSPSVGQPFSRRPAGDWRPVRARWRARRPGRRRAAGPRRWARRRAGRPGSSQETSRRGLRMPTRPEQRRPGPRRGPRSRTPGVWKARTGRGLGRLVQPPRLRTGAGLSGGDTAPSVRSVPPRPPCGRPARAAGRRAGRRTGALNCAGDHGADRRHGQQPGAHARDRVVDAGRDARVVLVGLGESTAAVSGATVARGRGRRGTTAGSESVQ